MDQRPDIKVHVRFKFSALWASLMFCYLYNDYFQLYQHGQLQAMQHGMMGTFAVTQGALLAASAVLAIPALMIFLSLALPSAVLRWLNVVLAVIYTIIDIMTMLSSWWYYVFFNGVETILTLLIFWYAIRWVYAARSNAESLTSECGS